MKPVKRRYSSAFRIPALFLFLVLCSPLQANSGQDSIPAIRVSLSDRNRNIRQALEEITFQTGLRFTYDADLIEGKQRISIDSGDMLLRDALDSLFRNPELSYRLIDQNIVIYLKSITTPERFSEEVDRYLLKGVVIDSRNRNPLPFATIGLFGTNLGSITNQEGEFSFKIPPRLTEPVLIVRYLGYNREIVPVNFPLEERLEIVLEKESIPLQEVIIRYTDPVFLVRQAMEQVQENYLPENSTMTAFYREAVRRNDHTMIYSEAVLDVAKGPYTPFGSGDQVRIRKARKITDVTVEDTVLVKLRSGVYTSLNLDVVKNRPDFLTPDFTERYDLTFSDLMSYGDRLVYVIRFDQKEEITELLFTGTLYIDLESLALVGVDFEYNPDLIHKEPDLFLVSRSPNIRIRPVHARYHVEYRRIDGDYHISQVRADMELKVRRKRQWIGSKYLISIEMAITDVIPDRRLRISPSDRLRSNVVLADEPFDFDPEFWGIYNTIEPEASLMESIRRIEHNLQEITP